MTIKLAGRVVTDHEARLFTRTFAHPVIGHLIAWVPTAWALTIANPTPAPVTDFGDWNGPNPTVSLDHLWVDLLEKGMRDPLFIGVGRVDRHVRLEAGNHRIQLLHKYGVQHVPAVALVADRAAIVPELNGDRAGMPMALKIPQPLDIMGPYAERVYMRLSDVLVDSPAV